MLQVISPLGDSVSSRRFSRKANYLIATSWDKVCFNQLLLSLQFFIYSLIKYISLTPYKSKLRPALNQPQIAIPCLAF